MSPKRYWCTAEGNNNKRTRKLPLPFFIPEIMFTIDLFQCSQKRLWPHQCLGWQLRKMTELKRHKLTFFHCYHQASTRFLAFRQAKDEQNRRTRRRKNKSNQKQKTTNKQTNKTTNKAITVPLLKRGGIRLVIKTEFRSCVKRPLT